jgi:hypothetical protein
MLVHKGVIDKVSIGLSVACTVHCLALPLLLILLPSLSALPLENEAFHLWLLAAILPCSAYALTLGCKQHKRYQLLFVGGVGIALLILAVTLGETLLGEPGEKILTLFGSIIVAVGHSLNYKLCKQPQNDCECNETRC